jgi:hypothetical protein
MREPSQLITKESSRQIIFEDFKLDLPITGGWGYDFESACVIDKNDSTVNQAMPFNGVAIEHVFVEKRRDKPDQDEQGAKQIIVFNRRKKQV